MKYLPPDYEFEQLCVQVYALRKAGASFNAIAAMLNRRGLRGPHGGRWFPATVRRAYLAVLP